MKIFPALASMEMLIINLITFDRCNHRKHGRGATGMVLAVFSLLFGICAVSFFPDFGDGRQMAGGFVFLIPFYFLYEEKLFRQFITMCMCWAYTYSIYVLSIQIARLIPADDMYLTFLILQTIFFVATLYPFFKWAVPKYLFILQNLERFGGGRTKYFNWNCFLHFLTVMALNIAFSQGNGSILKVLPILLLSATIVLSYAMLYRIISDSLRIYQLEQLSRQDSLTGLANRACLFDDLQVLLQNEESFSILFVDLDRFKEVNDQYGHIVGDQYLKHFAAICSKIFKNNGKTYRFGGDEFVVLCQGMIPQTAVKELQAGREWDQGAPCPFNRVSTGYMVCRPPFADAEQLLHQVDQKMYEMKAAARKTHSE